MERLHLSDFCDMVGGNLTNITPKHPASPKTYRKPMPTILGPDGLETADSIRLKQERIAWEDHMENRENSWYFTRPWVCDLKEYNATLVNIFAWVCCVLLPRSGARADRLLSPRVSRTWSTPTRLRSSTTVLVCDVFLLLYAERTLTRLC